VKRIVLNSGLVACLMVVLVSFWIIATPRTALAAGATATCSSNPDDTVSCHADGSACFSFDKTVNANGYCICWSLANGDVTDFKVCGDDAPYID
jgi:hypothetical protein